MILIDYKCPKCQEVFELEKDSRKLCPNCRTKLERIWSPISVKFKGSGFYCVDSRKKKA